MAKKTSINELDLAREHVFLAGGQTYVLPKGKVGQRDHKRRFYLCWQKTEDGIYYTCPCGRINRMSVNLAWEGKNCGIFLDGSMVGTFGCEYCLSCHSHLWYVLKDFPVKTIQKKLVKEPRQCPLCGFMSGCGSSGFTACQRCSFHWRA